MRTEFEFINHIKKKYSLDFVGDDCAVLPKDDKTDLLMTSDLLIEDIDFRLNWTEPELLGYKSLAVSLSDVAAMGGKPGWAMLALGVPQRLWSSDFMDRFYEGWHSLASEHGVDVAGGDISRSPDRLVVDSVVGGEVERGRAALRSGANVGDAIFVTGFLGGAAGGLRLLEAGARFDDSLSASARHLLLRQLQPISQTRTASVIQDYSLASSMIDVSDGLSSDLRHLVTASGVGAAIFADAIPIDPAMNEFPLFADDAFHLAMNGGEDFELLLTVAQDNVATALDLGFHKIGEITPNVGIIEVIRDGRAEILQPKGYRHF